MRPDAPVDLAHIVANPARVADLRAEDVPALLGVIEQLRVALWARMVRAPGPAARDPGDAGGERLFTVAEATGREPGLRPAPARAR